MTLIKFLEGSTKAGQIKNQSRENCIEERGHKWEETDVSIDPPEFDPDVWSRLIIHEECNNCEATRERDGGFA